MRLIPAAVGGLVLSTLAACVQTLTIPPVTLPASGTPKIPGHFAAWIDPAPMPQELGSLHNHYGANDCLAYSANLDLTPPLTQAIKTALDDFQSIDFLPTALSQSEIRKAGYQAEFVFQSTHSGGTVKTGGFFQKEGEVAVETNLTVIGANDVRPPVVISAAGEGSSGPFIICTQIGLAAQEAYHAALTDLAQKVKVAVRGNTGG